MVEDKGLNIKNSGLGNPVPVYFKETAWLGKCRAIVLYSMMKEGLIPNTLNTNDSQSLAHI